MKDRVVIHQMQEPEGYGAFDQDGPDEGLQPATREIRDELDNLFKHQEIDKLNNS